MEEIIEKILMYGVIYAVLAVVLFLGLRASLHVKSCNDYIIASRNVITPVLAMSFLVTMLDSLNTVWLINWIYKYGPIVLICSILTFICFLYLIFVLAKRFDMSNEMLSIADMGEHFYGRKVGKIIAFFATLAMVSLFGTQIYAMKKFILQMLGKEGVFLLCVVVCLLIFYTSLGGIKSVLITDTVQFVLIIVIFPMLSNLMINSDLSHLREGMSFVDIVEEVEWSKKNQNWWIVFPFLLPFARLMNPALIQRFFTMKPDERARKIKILGVSGICVLLCVISSISIIAFAAYSLDYIELKEKLGQDFDVNELCNRRFMLSNIINPYFKNPVLKGLVIVSVLSVMISSADSYLNISSVLCIHNFPNLKSISDRRKLRFLKYTTVVLGILGVLFAVFVLENNYMWPDGKINIRVWFFSRGIFALFLEMIGFMLFIALMKVKFKRVVLSCVVVVSMVLAFYDYEIFGYRMIYIAMVVYMSFFILLLFKNQGFTPRALWIKLLRVKNIFVKRGISGLPIGDRKASVLYIPFSIFVLVDYSFPNFLINHVYGTGVVTEYYNLIFVLKLFSVLFAISILFRNYWMESVRKFLHIYWVLGLCYSLLFLPSFIMICSDFNTSSVVNFTVCIVLLGICIGGKGLLLSAIKSALLGVIIYCLLTNEKLEFLIRHIYTVLYAIMVAVLSIILASKVQKRHRERSRDLRELAGLMSGRFSVASYLFNIRFELEEKMQQLNMNKKELKILEGPIKVFRRISNKVLLLEQYLTLVSRLISYEGAKMVKSYYSVLECIATGINFHKNSYVKDREGEIIMRTELKKDFPVYVDAKTLAAVIWVIIEQLLLHIPKKCKITFTTDPKLYEVGICITERCFDAKGCEEFLSRIYNKVEDKVMPGAFFIHKHLKEMRVSINYKVYERSNCFIMKFPILNSSQKEEVLRAHGSIGKTMLNDEEI